MRLSRYTSLLPAALLCLCAASSAYAATPDQMDRAKAIAYKYCLRYMNNGSGYLDDTKPSSTSELRASLKAKEQDNLKTLESISIPPESEYSKWGKEEFNKFWKDTFFSSGKLNFAAKGACKARAAEEIGKLAVTKVEAKPEAPAPAEAEANTPEQSAATEQNQTEQAPAPAADPTMQALVDAPVADTVIDAVEIPVEAVEVPAEQVKEKSVNYTAIIILCALVLVVVALVAYALNVMKRNKEREQGASRSSRRGRGRRYEDEEDEDEEEEEELRTARRSPEPRRQAYTVQSDLAEESAFAAYSAYEEPVPRYTDDHAAYQPKPTPTPTRSERDREIEQLRAEVAALRSQLADSHARRTASAERRYTPGSRTQGPAQVIYLAPANVKGVFTRADAHYNPGTSIFKLITTDGVAGSFAVIDEPTAQDLALMDPHGILMTACTGRNLDYTNGVGHIVNEASGTAIFEDGRWYVTRKAQIRYTR